MRLVLGGSIRRFIISMVVLMASAMSAIAYCMLRLGHLGIVLTLIFLAAWGLFCCLVMVSDFIPGEKQA